MPAALSLNRRAFLACAPAALLHLRRQTPAGAREETPAGSFPLQDRDLVREIVTAAHGNIGRVKALVADYPALARASWDWGFGDHEAAIDAASHMGHRPIAEFLIAHGARPTIFTAAMLGHLPVVTATVEALPGIQRSRGPHGITLLAHARAGGRAAAGVCEYLERLGDADPAYADRPVPSAEAARIPGQYLCGTGPHDRWVVERNPRGELTLARPGVMSARRLFHQGGLRFLPPGAETAVIRFEVTASGEVTLFVQDGPSSVTARRTAAGGV